MDFNKDVMAAKLRGRRAEAGMNQTQAAEAAGVSIVTLGRYENGESSPNGNVLFKLAKAYGCTPNDLFGWGDPAHGGKEEL